MAIINYTDQIKYAGRGYLDAKMMPVNTVDDLYAIYNDEYVITLDELPKWK